MGLELMARSGTMAHGRPRGDVTTPGGDVRQWFGSGTTTNGAVTFFPTSDGTVTGDPVFSEILAVFASGVQNTAVATEAPLTSVKSATARAVTVNCVTGTVLGVLGATVVAAPDGTEVHCLVVGV